MKKITRILSVALVAVMLLSASAVSFAADDTTAYIPTRLAKLGLDVDLSDIQYPELSVKITNTAKMVIGYTDDNKPIYEYANPDYCIDYRTGAKVPVKSITEDSVAQYQFTEKPDWFGVNLSALDGGWANIEIDDDGYGEFEIGELHKQPGMWVSWDGDTKYRGGDYPYSGGKDYGDYSVNVNYHRDGSAYQVTITFKNAGDPFLTGMEGAVVTVVYESVELVTDCYLDAVDDWITNGHKNSKGCYTPRPTPTSEWYLSHVGVSYPEGNYIAGIGTDWRNDAKQNLASYRVVYAVSENAYYRITYAPKTTSIYENHTPSLKTETEVTIRGNKFDTTGKYTDLGKQDSSAAYYPSQKIAVGKSVQHYTADQPIYGEFFKSRADAEAGNVYAVSGSGNNLGKWYEFFGKEDDWSLGVGNVRNNNGKRVKSIKKSCTSFKSPRRLTK